MPCRAAALAGIVPASDTGGSGSQLVLLYEPEAAALTTCAQPNVRVESGERFLILDAGESAAHRGIAARTCQLVRQTQMSDQAVPIMRPCMPAQTNQNHYALCLPAGGGTVDFTMHVVEERNGGKVLSEATYRACLLQVSTGSQWGLCKHYWQYRSLLTAPGPQWQIPSASMCF